MSDRCRGCNHPESEHKGLGCVHEKYVELRSEDPDGSITIRSDLSVCGCDYFRMTLDHIINELDESAADIRAAINNQT
jgi:hypothetical protein